MKFGNLFKQDGNSSKTGLVYGAAIVVLILVVLTICVIAIIMAAQGNLTLDKVKELIGLANDPATMTLVGNIMYNTERGVKAWKSVKENGNAKDTLAQEGVEKTE